MTRHIRPSQFTPMARVCSFVVCVLKRSLGGNNPEAIIRSGFKAPSRAVHIHVGGALVILYQPSQNGETELPRVRHDRQVNVSSPGPGRRKGEARQRQQGLAPGVHVKYHARSCSSSNRITGLISGSGNLGTVTTRIPEVFCNGLVVIV